MDISGVTNNLLSASQAVSEWIYDNPIWTDSIVVLIVIGSLVFLARKSLRMRRLAHRIRWGAGMKRSKNREAFERGLISFGICDAIEEAVWRGDMHRDRADFWYQSFADDYNMQELRPRKPVTNEQKKDMINKRIMLWDKIRVRIPGLHPRAELKVDQTYQPIADDKVVALNVPGKRAKSKYSKAS